MRGEVSGTRPQRVLDHWSRLIELPSEELVAAMLVGGERGDELRQLSPLLGVATPTERAAALERAYAR
jgi:hypothetical protein